MQYLICILVAFALFLMCDVIIKDDVKNYQPSSKVITPKEQKAIDQQQKDDDDAASILLLFQLL